jgi:hypothetical protein
MQIMAESSSSNSQSAAPSSPTLSTSSTASSPKVYLNNGVAKKKKRRDLNGNKMADRQNSEGSEIGLGDVDIEQNVYEGGFKSWEGAVDLARLVLERGPRKDIDDLSRVDSVVEVNSVSKIALNQTNIQTSSDVAQPYQLSFCSNTPSYKIYPSTSPSATTTPPFSASSPSPTFSSSGHSKTLHPPSHQHRPHFLALDQQQLSKKATAT